MTVIARVLLAALAAGLLGTTAGWLLTGAVFHRFQARTPATWRAAEGPAQYAAASALSLCAAAGVAALVALTGGVPIAVPVGAGGAAGRALNGLVFGVLCWRAPLS